MLGRCFPPHDAQKACDILLAPSNDVSKIRWPRCFGTLRTPKAPTPGQWFRRDGDGEHTSALLFEYFPDLEPLTREVVTVELSREYKQVLSDLHSLKILHRDQILHAAWPEVVFNNIFLRHNTATGGKGWSISMLLYKIYPASNRSIHRNHDTRLR